jgi:DNA replication protein DnaC
MSRERNLLLTGNPGIGKTTLMVSLAKALAYYGPCRVCHAEDQGWRNQERVSSCKGHCDMEIVHYSHCVP